MIELFEGESGDLIGTITEAQLQFLIDQLEEEDSEDQDYYIDRGSLIWFEEQNVDPDLITMLREALGDRQGMDIRWTK